jgi:uncharacterized membrane protein YcaP (DUF421 family)
MFHNPKLNVWIQDQPEILVKDGIVDLERLQKCEITSDELLESIREHGVESVDKVNLAILEVDGNISIVSTDSNQQTNFTRHKRKFPRKAHKF